MLDEDPIRRQVESGHEARWAAEMKMYAETSVRHARSVDPVGQDDGQRGDPRAAVAASAQAGQPAPRRSRGRAGRRGRSRRWRRAACSCAGSRQPAPGVAAGEEHRGASSGNVLCMWTTSGRRAQKVALKIATDLAVPDRCGRGAGPCAQAAQSAISSLCRSKVSTSCPAARKRGALLVDDVVLPARSATNGTDRARPGSSWRSPSWRDKQ